MVALEPRTFIHYLSGADKSTTRSLVQLSVVSDNKTEIFMDPQEAKKFINTLDK